MGRAKLSLKLKDSKKARRVTFEKRRKALEKKAFELSTLCGVKIGMILYGPSEGDGPVEPTIWPENREEIEDLISSYKNGSDKQFCRQRTYNLLNFYKDELKKVKEELAKTRKKNIETKYPTWDEEYDKLTSQELKSISSLIQDKIEIVKSRINLVKAMMNQKQQSHSGLNYQQRLMPSFDDHEPFDIVDEGLMTMMMNNGASSSGGADENLVSQDFGIGFLDNILLPNDELMMMCNYFPNVCAMPEYVENPFCDLQDQVCLY